MEGLCLGGSLSGRVSVWEGLCPGEGSLSREGVSVQEKGVSVQRRGLCPGEGGLCPEGSLSGGSLSGGLCPGGLCQVDRRGRNMGPETETPQREHETRDIEPLWTDKHL